MGSKNKKMKINNNDSNEKEYKNTFNDIIENKEDTQDVVKVVNIENIIEIENSKNIYLELSTKLKECLDEFKIKYPLKDYYENKLLVLFKELGVLSENREFENKEKIENNTIINTENHIENIGINEICEREDLIGDIGINGDDDENGEIIKRTTTPIKTSKNTIPKKKITIKALFPGGLLYWVCETSNNNISNYSS